jgi:DNA-binding HxlR family transcriptional regulator
MTRRTFDQYCPIARSLEVVGERWALLIVRELLVGPARYTDLRRALPGMWTNLLADRLRHLEAHGVIRRQELPPPADRIVYELTDRGRELEPVVLGLGRWGFPFLTGRRREHLPLSTVVLAGLRAFFHSEHAAEINERFEVRIEREVFAALVQQGRLDIRRGPPDDSSATLEINPKALLDVRLGRLDVKTAIDRGLVQFHGPQRSIRQLRRVFGL